MHSFDVPNRHNHTDRHNPITYVMSWDLCHHFWRLLSPFWAAFAPMGPLFCALRLARITPVIGRGQPIGIALTGPAPKFYFLISLHCYFKSTMAAIHLKRKVRGILPAQRCFVAWACSFACTTLCSIISIVRIYHLGMLLLMLPLFACSSIC